MFIYTREMEGGERGDEAAQGTPLYPVLRSSSTQQLRVPGGSQV